MFDSNTVASRRPRRRHSSIAALVSFALIAAACGGSDDDASTASEPTDASADSVATTEVDDDVEPADSTPASEPEGDDGEPADTDAEEPADSTAADEPEAADSENPAQVFPSLAPPTGEVMKVGLINSEGSPGLDFPDIRINISATFDYLNEHGGMGGRPVELVSCSVDGSPESSQACAQEVTGRDVELVLLGLDLFPDYATFTAADVPVIGMVPVLPGDYTADALFLTGGNATSMAAIAAVADVHFNAETVGIISADNVGSNASEIALIASLEVAGISYTTVKGGDNETDAGFQGLMRQVDDSDPDVIVSLYADGGCIGTMRGRAALGIETPVIATAICADSGVLEAVGDDALGWIFSAIQTNRDTPEKLILQNIVAPALGVDPEEVDPAALGLGGLAIVTAMSLTVFANDIAATGGDVTGESVYQYLETTPALEQWPTGDLIECGQSEAYSAVCSFTFPFAEYVEGGGVMTVPGLEAVSSVDYLP